MQSEMEMQQRAEALAQAVKCLVDTEADENDIVRYSQTFLAFLVNDESDTPQPFVKGDGYVIKWRGIDYIPAPTT